jgi:putative transposon-encoded protein
MMCVPKRHIGVVYDVCVVVLCMMCVPKRHIGVVYDVCAEETHRCCE